jgi:hypothetical protein
MSNESGVQAAISGNIWVTVQIPASEPVLKGPFSTHAEVKDSLFAVYHKRGDANCLVISGSMDDLQVIEGKTWLAYDGCPAVHL